MMSKVVVSDLYVECKPITNKYADYEVSSPFVYHQKYKNFVDELKQDEAVPKVKTYKEDLSTGYRIHKIYQPDAGPGHLPPSPPPECHRVPPLDHHRYPSDAHRDRRPSRWDNHQYPSHHSHHGSPYHNPPKAYKRRKSHLQDIYGPNYDHEDEPRDDRFRIRNHRSRNVYKSLITVDNKSVKNKDSLTAKTTSSANGNNKFKKNTDNIPASIEKKVLSTNKPGSSNGSSPKSDDRSSPVNQKQDDDKVTKNKTQSNLGTKNDSQTNETKSETNTSEKIEKIDYQSCKSVTKSNTAVTTSSSTVTDKEVFKESEPLTAVNRLTEMTVSQKADSSSKNTATNVDHKKSFIREVSFEMSSYSDCITANDIDTSRSYLENCPFVDNYRLIDMDLGSPVPYKKQNNVPEFSTDELLIQLSETIGEVNQPSVSIENVVCPKSSSPEKSSENTENGSVKENTNIQPSNPTMDYKRKLSPNNVKRNLIQDQLEEHNSKQKSSLTAKPMHHTAKIKNRRQSCVETYSDAKKRKVDTEVTGLSTERSSTFLESNKPSRIQNNRRSSLCEDRKDFKRPLSPNEDVINKHPRRTSLNESSNNPQKSKDSRVASVEDSNQVEKTAEKKKYEYFPNLKPNYKIPKKNSFSEAGTPFMSPMCSLFRKDQDNCRIPPTTEKEDKNKDNESNNVKRVAFRKTTTTEKEDNVEHKDSNNAKQILLRKKEDTCKVPLTTEKDDRDEDKNSNNAKQNRYTATIEKRVGRPKTECIENKSGKVKGLINKNIEGRNNTKTTVANKNNTDKPNNKGIVKYSKEYLEKVQITEDSRNKTKVNQLTSDKVDQTIEEVVVNKNRTENMGIYKSKHISKAITKTKPTNLARSQPHAKYEKLKSNITDIHKSVKYAKETEAKTKKFKGSTAIPSSPKKTSNIPKQVTNSESLFNSKETSRSPNKSSKEPESASGSPKNMERWSVLNKTSPKITLLDNSAREQDQLKSKQLEESKSATDKLIELLSGSTSNDSSYSSSSERELLVLLPLSKNLGTKTSKTPEVIEKSIEFSQSANESEKEVKDVVSLSIEDKSKCQSILIPTQLDDVTNTCDKENAEVTLSTISENVASDENDAQDNSLSSFSENAATDNSKSSDNRNVSSELCSKLTECESDSKLQAAHSAGTSHDSEKQSIPFKSLPDLTKNTEDAVDTPQPSLSESKDPLEMVSDDTSKDIAIKETQHVVQIQTSLNAEYPDLEKLKPLDGKVTDFENQSKHQSISAIESEYSTDNSEAVIDIPQPSTNCMFQLKNSSEIVITDDISMEITIKQESECSDPIKAQSLEGKMTESENKTIPQAISSNTSSTMESQLLLRSLSCSTENSEAVIDTPQPSTMCMSELKNSSEIVNSEDTSMETTIKQESMQIVQIQTAVKSEYPESEKVQPLVLPKFPRSNSVRMLIIENECTDQAIILENPEVLTDYEIVKVHLEPDSENDSQEIIEIKDPVHIIDLTEDDDIEVIAEDSNTITSDEELKLYQIFEEYIVESQENITLYRSDESKIEDEDVQATCASLTASAVLGTNTENNTVKTKLESSPEDPDSGNEEPIKEELPFNSTADVNSSEVNNALLVEKQNDSMTVPVSEDASYSSAAITTALNSIMELAAEKSNKPDTDDQVNCRNSKDDAPKVNSEHSHSLSGSENESNSANEVQVNRNKNKGTTSIAAGIHATKEINRHIQRDPADIVLAAASADSVLAGASTVGEAHGRPNTETSYAASNSVISDRIDEIPMSNGLQVCSRDQTNETCLTTESSNVFTVASTNGTYTVSIATAKGTFQSSQIDSGNLEQYRSSVATNRDCGLAEVQPSPTTNGVISAVQERGILNVLENMETESCTLQYSRTTNRNSSNQIHSSDSSSTQANPLAEQVSGKSNPVNDSAFESNLLQTRIWPQYVAEFVLMAMHDIILTKSYLKYMKSKSVSATVCNIQLKIYQASQESKHNSYGTSMASLLNNMNIPAGIGFHPKQAIAIIVGHLQACGVTSVIQIYLYLESLMSRSKEFYLRHPYFKHLYYVVSTTAEAIREKMRVANGQESDTPKVTFSPQQLHILNQQIDFCNRLTRFLVSTMTQTQDKAPGPSEVPKLVPVNSSMRQQYRSANPKSSKTRSINNQAQTPSNNYTSVNNSPSYQFSMDLNAAVKQLNQDSRDSQYFQYKTLPHLTPERLQPRHPPPPYRPQPQVQMSPQQTSHYSSNEQQPVVSNIISMRQLVNNISPPVQISPRGQVNDNRSTAVQMSPLRQALNSSANHAYRPVQMSPLRHINDNTPPSVQMAPMRHSTDGPVTTVHMPSMRQSNGNLPSPGQMSPMRHNIHMSSIRQANDSTLPSVQMSPLRQSVGGSVNTMSSTRQANDNTIPSVQMSPLRQSVGGSVNTMSSTRQANDNTIPSVQMSPLRQSVGGSVNTMSSTRQANDNTIPSVQMSPLRQSVGGSVNTMSSTRQANDNTIPSVQMSPLRQSVGGSVNTMSSTRQVNDSTIPSVQMSPLRQSVGGSVNTMYSTRQVDGNAPTVQMSPMRQSVNMHPSLQIPSTTKAIDNITYSVQMSPMRQPEITLKYLLNTGGPPNVTIGPPNVPNPTFKIPPSRCSQLRQVRHNSPMSSRVGNDSINNYQHFNVSPAPVASNATYSSSNVALSPVSTVANYPVSTVANSPVSTVANSPVSSTSCSPVSNLFPSPVPKVVSSPVSTVPVFPVTYETASPLRNAIASPLYPCGDVRNSPHANLVTSCRDTPSQSMPPMTQVEKHIYAPMLFTPSYISERSNSPPSVSPNLSPVCESSNNSSLVNEPPNDPSPITPSPINELPANSSPINELPDNLSPINELPDNSSPISESASNGSPARDSSIKEPSQSENERSSDNDVIDLTWLDDIDTEEFKQEFLFIKKEEIEEEEVILNQEQFPESCSPADSGFENSPSPQVEYNELVYHGRLCICEKPADYICGCRMVMYCSELCQRQDWNQHKKICGKGPMNRT